MIVTLATPHDREASNLGRCGGCCGNGGLGDVRGVSVSRVVSQRQRGSTVIGESFIVGAGAGVSELMPPTDDLRSAANARYYCLRSRPSAACSRHTSAKATRSARVSVRVCVGQLQRSLTSSLCGGYR